MSVSGRTRARRTAARLATPKSCGLRRRARANVVSTVTTRPPVLAMNVRPMALAVRCLKRSWGGATGDPAVGPAVLKLSSGLSPKALPGGHLQLDPRLAAQVALRRLDHPRRQVDADDPPERIPARQIKHAAFAAAEVDEDVVRANLAALQDHLQRAPARHPIRLGVHGVEPK